MKWKWYYSPDWCFLFILILHKFISHFNLQLINDLSTWCLIKYHWCCHYPSFFSIWFINSYQCLSYCKNNVSYSISDSYGYGNDFICLQCYSFRHQCYRFRHQCYWYIKLTCCCSNCSNRYKFYWLSYQFYSYSNLPYCYSNYFNRYKSYWFRYQCFWNSKLTCCCSNCSNRYTYQPYCFSY